jgi:hypothetical protein
MNPHKEKIRRLQRLNMITSKQVNPHPLQREKDQRWRDKWSWLLAGRSTHICTGKIILGREISDYYY